MIADLRGVFGSLLSPTLALVSRVRPDPPREAARYPTDNPILRAQPMTFDSFYVLAQLQDLERRLAETPRRVESLRIAYLREDRPEIVAEHL